MVTGDIDMLVCIFLLVLFLFVVAYRLLTTGLTVRNEWKIVVCTAKSFIHYSAL